MQSFSACDILYALNHGDSMSFTFDGVVIRKTLSKEIRERLVSDVFDKADPKTGVISVYKRVTYYDPNRRFNVYVASRKLGERDPLTKEVKAGIRKLYRKDRSNDLPTVLVDKAETHLSDSRQQAKVVYALAPCVEIFITAAMGGHFGPKYAANYWLQHIDFFKKRWPTDIPSTAPSISCTNRLLRTINPDEFQSLMQEFVLPLLPGSDGSNGKRDVVAVDGQAVRASTNKEGRHHQFLSFFSTDTGIAFAQIRIDDKSNEIPAALALAKKLDLHGSIVTGDAMHCQREFVETLMTQCGADYLIALKNNQNKLMAKTKELFRTVPVDLHGSTTEKGHGREEVREVFILPGSLLPKAIRDLWFGLETGIIIKQVNRRTVIHGKNDREPTTVAERYFISSLQPSEKGVVDTVQRTVRSHWGIENSLHHILDVDYGQDGCQMRNANVISNVALINKIALAATEFGRRKLAASSGAKREITLNEVKHSLQNNPQLATQFLEDFLRAGEVQAIS